MGSHRRKDTEKGNTVSYQEYHGGIEVPTEEPVTCEVHKILRPEGMNKLLVDKLCSRCGHYFGTDITITRGAHASTTESVEVPDFCPECGARMVK